MQVAVRATGDAVSAQRATETCLTAVDVPSGECPIAAGAGTDTTFAASGLNTDSPWIDFSKDIGKQSHGAIGGAVGHEPCSSRPGEHDYDSAKTKDNSKYDGDRGRQSASAKEYRRGENHRQDQPAPEPCPAGQGVGPCPAGGRPVIPGADITEMTAPGRTDQNQGDGKENDHEEPLAAIQRPGGYQCRYGQMQTAGHQKALET